MRLSQIVKSTKHLFRGTTSLPFNNIDQSAKFILKSALDGNLDGRYFCYNDPRAAAKYGVRSLLIEADILSNDLVYENFMPIVLLNDRYYEDGASKDEINKAVGQLKERGVPDNIISQFVNLVNCRNSNQSCDIHHYDGTSTNEISEFSRMLSKYVLEDGAQVALHHRDLLPEELVAIYRIGFADEELQKASDLLDLEEKHNESLLYKLGIRDRSLEADERESRRLLYVKSAKSGARDTFYKLYQRLLYENGKFAIRRLYYNRGDAVFNIGDIF